MYIYIYIHIYIYIYIYIYTIFIQNSAQGVPARGCSRRGGCSRPDYFSNQIDEDTFFSERIALRVPPAETGLTVYRRFET